MKTSAGEEIISIRSANIPNTPSCLSMRDPVSWQPAETSTAQQRRTYYSLRHSQSGFRPDVAHSILNFAPAGGEPAIKTYASEPVNENCFSLFSAAPPKAAAKQRCFSYRCWDDGASFGDSRFTTIQPPLGAAPILYTSSMPVRPFQPCAPIFPISGIRGSRVVQATLFPIMPFL